MPLPGCVSHLTGREMSGIPRGADAPLARRGEHGTTQAPRSGDAPMRVRGHGARLFARPLQRVVRFGSCVWACLAASSYAPRRSEKINSDR